MSSGQQLIWKQFDNIKLFPNYTTFAPDYVPGVKYYSAPVADDPFFFFAAGLPFPAGADAK